MHIAKVIALSAGFGTICIMSSWSLFQSTTENQPPSSQVHSTNKALEAYKLKNTLDFLNQHAPDIDLTTDIGKKRLELLIDKYSDAESPEELILLYESFPNSFEYKEAASIAIARAYLSKQQFEQYDEMRRNWKGHERQTAEWFFLDAELLMMNQRTQEAAAWLNSRTFKGEAETERLIRLSLLFLVDDPKLSWKYLAEASSKDPQNPSLNTFKANLLESANKHEMALAEYIQAVQKDPENPLPREQLADFYCRTHQYTEAIQILTDSLTAPSSDTIWLKALFLSRVIAPIKYNWNVEQIPAGELHPLVAFIMDLPPGIFWSQMAFDKLPKAENYLNQQQETFWLRLLMALKANRESEALEILQQNPFQTTSWMPELECHLKSVLTYRQAQLQSTQASEHENTAKNISNINNNDKQVCLETLTAISKTPIDDITAVDISKNLHDFLLSKEIFASLFLTAGWDEAALHLHTLAVIPAEFPEWLTLELTGALSRNRGVNQAMQFAQNQKATPELHLLMAQLALKIKQPNLAIDKLKQLYKRNDALGLKAAKLLSTIYLKQNDNNAAKETILAQPTLAAELASREILAKIALQSGDIIAANNLYLSLEKESSEARAFLARKAFSDKNWKRAKELTEQLIKQYPDNQVLKDNMHNILLEEQKEQFAKKRSANN